MLGFCGQNYINNIPTIALLTSWVSEPLDSSIMPIQIFHYKVIRSLERVQYLHTEIMSKNPPFHLYRVSLAICSLLH